MTLAADPKRNELKALLVEVYDYDAGTGPPGPHPGASREDKLRKEVKRMGKFTINQASNYLTPSALAQLVCIGIKRRQDSDDKLFLHALEMSADAVNDPTTCAMPNPKSANGYGWGHHKVWKPKIVLQSIAELVGDIDVTEPPAPQPTQTAPLGAIDPNLSQAIDTLLNKATGGTETSIQRMFDERQEQAQTAIDALKALRDSKEENERLRQQVTARPIVTSGDQQVDGKKLSYTVVPTPAWDLFRRKGQGENKELLFEVSTLKWKDGKDEVQHPAVPDIDPSYQFRPELLKKFLASTQLGMNVWMHGHTGTGKTTFAEQCAARTGLPFYRVNLDSNLERADLVGQIVLSQESGATVTEFDEGILPQAMSQPCWLCLDECDSGRPDILFVIQRALEAKGLMLTEDGGRLVHPHPMFRFIATANSRGQGDEAGVYSGVRPMNGAFMNRWQTQIEVPYLSITDEKRLLKAKFGQIEESRLAQLAQFAEEMRVAFKGGDITLPVSPRDLQCLCEMFEFFRANGMETDKAWTTAMEMAILDKAPEDNLHRVHELRDRCFN
jgi:cobaltochelatase CobS